MSSKTLGISGTFLLNKSEPIHGWYSYLEGYSSCLIDDLINDIGLNKISAIYDPFCGTGTTCLVASKYGIPSFYSETNPFMCDVIESKINSVINIRNNKKAMSELKIFYETLPVTSGLQPLPKKSWGGFEKYFDDDVLVIILELKKKIDMAKNEDVKNILYVLLSSVLVRCSKMIRRGDLRYAKDGEKKDEDRDILMIFSDKVKNAIADISNENVILRKKTTCIGQDAMKVSEQNLVDCIITSPPYLNGTNYIRNTKLELKLTNYVNSEKDLAKFHSKGVIAGINNVSSRNAISETPNEVVKLVKKLEPITYDRRIPRMIAGYFRDMELVVQNLSNIMKEGGVFIMDIGDSQFSGIHIPTHDVLKLICKKYGFKLYEETIIRERRSKNNMVLSQRLLKFRFNEV